MRVGGTDDGKVSISAIGSAGRRWRGRLRDGRPDLCAFRGVDHEADIVFGETEPGGLAN